MDDDAHLYHFTVPKAGMAAGEAQAAVNARISQLSRGSSYAVEQARKARQTDERIAELRARLASKGDGSAAHAHRKVEEARTQTMELQARFEQERAVCLDRRWIVVDLDMFFAAIEIRDNPELALKPVAVGDLSMISTTNYIARKFGVRSAMPGFIGKALCPDLVFVKANYEKYQLVGEEIRTIFAEYDSNFSTMSLDEAALDVTDFIYKSEQRSNLTPQELDCIAFNLATEIRERIRARVQLTASAGIACNHMLAKICTDWKKPDGQFALESNPDAILQFMNPLPVRKICGIGRVTEHMLEEIGIKKCDDILDASYLLWQAFSSAHVEWLVAACMGVARNRHSEPQPRKSVSLQRTFSVLYRPPDLEEKLGELAEKLAAQLVKGQVLGKCVTIIMKEESFRTRTRAVTLRRFIGSFNDLFSAALPLLQAEYPLRLRLMGLRLSSLNTDVNMGQPTLISDYFSKENQESIPIDDEQWLLYECPVCGHQRRAKSAMQQSRHVEACLMKKNDIHDDDLTESRKRKQKSEKRLKNSNVKPITYYFKRKH